MDDDVEEKLKDCLSIFLFYNVIGLIKEAKTLALSLMKVADAKFTELTNQGTNNGDKTLSAQDKSKIVRLLTPTVGGLSKAFVMFYPLNAQEKVSIQQKIRDRFINYYTEKMN